MDYKTKKIIAREFLIFMSCLFVALLFYSGTHYYNYRLHKKIQTLRQERDQLNEAITNLSLTISKKEKVQKEFYESLKNEGFSIEESAYSDLWKKFQKRINDTIYINKWKTLYTPEYKEWHAFLEKRGLEEFNDFAKFINLFSFTQSDSISIQKTEEWRIKRAALYLKISVLKNKPLPHQKQIHVSLIFFSILIGLSFLGRYTFKAIFWSIKILTKR